MESEGNGWRDELSKYFSSVENLTGKALERIKRDRIRNNLSFDESFKKYFLDRTNFRIATAYTDFLCADRFEQQVNQQSHVNAGASIQHPLASTIIGPESIEQMPIILIQSSNENLALNPSISTTFIQDSSQMSDQIMISMPSKKLQSDPSKAGNSQSPDHKSRAQSTDRIAMENEQRMESVKTDEQLIEVNSSKGNEKLNTSVSRMMMEPPSTEAKRSKRAELINKLVISSTHQQAETIDLTSDQEDTADSQNVGQTQSNIRRQKANEAPAAAESLMEMERSKIFLHGGTLLQSNKCRIGQSSHLNTSTLKSRKSQKSSNDSNAHRVVNGYEKTQTVGDGPNGSKGYSSVQSSNTIDLVSVHPESANQNINGDAEKAAEQSQPKIQPQNTKSNKPNGSAHLKKKPESSGVEGIKKRHKCDFCEYSNKYRSLLVIHIRTHTNERPYECVICKKRFTHQGNLNAHMKTHRDLFQFQCSNCGQEFSDKMKWRSHESHCKKKRYECHLCGKKFHFGKSDLLVHMRHKHTGEKPFGCSDCPKRFCSKSHLAYHTKRCHLKDK